MLTRLAHLPHLSRSLRVLNARPCVSTSHTLICHNCLLLARPPGARPGCHTLFSSCPRAFTSWNYPSVWCSWIWLITQRLLKQVSSLWQTDLSTTPAPTVLFDGWIRNAVYITGLLERADRYLISPRHAWAGCITDWLLWLANSKAPRH